MSALTEKTDLTLKMVQHFNEVKKAINDSSPEILNAPRKRAFQEFVKQGLPSRKNENYKYTNVQPFFLPDYSFNHLNDKHFLNVDQVFKCDVPKLDTHLVLLRNGWFDNDNINNLPSGVIVGSIKEIAEKNPEILQNYYSSIAKSEEDPLIALNTAMAIDGYIVYIPKNVKINKAIQVINILQSPDDSYVTQRNLIIAEEGAEVKFLICDHTLNSNKYLYNTVTEIFAGENAKVDYYTIQNQHNSSATVNSVYARQEQNSSLRTVTTTLHGGMIRNNLKVILDGENCQTDIFGMAFLDKNQHVDNFTQIIHAKPHCLSNQIYKNVMDEESTGVFSGRIHVVRDAQKTNAFQRNNNLLLTDKAKMHTKPQLIIDADDVKCSHGATVGQIDEEALFYLRARGIPEKDARLMMMNAFAHEVIQEINLEPLRNRIDELIDKRLRGEIGRCHDCIND